MVVDAATLVRRSGDASMVFLPLRTRGHRVIDPFGKPVEALLEKLPATVLISAAEDIDLEAGDEPVGEPAVDPAADPAPEVDPDAAAGSPA